MSHGDEGMTSPGLTAEERQLADALAGDGEALAALAHLDAGGELARRHRAGPALHLRAARRALDTPAVAAWHRQLLATTAHHLRIETTVEEVAGRLAAAGIEWLPLKGYDLATRLYDTPEERPTADVDLLIRRGRLAEARRALEAAGWKGLYEGPRNRRFLAEEGYAWMAEKADRAFLELHFRLWGLVPEGFAEALIERSSADEDLAPGGRRLRLADAYLVAAVHSWLTSPPRPLVAWWDLARIAERLEPREVDAVVRAARRWDLELPVALAAEVSDTLWRHAACAEIRRLVATDLRRPERWLASYARRRGLAGVPLAALQAARLAAGRRSRQGWRGAWRRIWSHPGIVERSTPDDWPWLRRRLTYQLRPFLRRRRWDR